MELHFLGTGAGVPSKKRNVSSLALQMLQERGSTWLFDCGEATQHQILHTNIRPRRIEKIFITHLHGDHIFGLPGLLGSRSFQGGETPLEIYGPKGIEAFVETALTISGTRLKYNIEIIEIDEEGIIFEDHQFLVECRSLDHGLSSFGYSIQEKDSPGELLVDQLKADGIEPGPIYQKIKDNPTVTLEDGRVLNRKDYIGPDKKGRKVCIFGDTRYVPNLTDFARNADVLVHEATFAEGEEAMAHDYHHSTTIQAAQFAKDSHVQKLILNHISSRYQNDMLETLREQARTIFPHTDIATDLSHFQVPNQT
ncbi:ribonuclease Z [Pontibacillus halophilus JSM 076056 = DSM 19796]|uniref:Ribonuclease Z n=1 Tax=Pontibacillus halophilus JSM 076056 = DSM 19796 TaxID=1385510 RepID=A0A0A5I662_9BACI|nr:ribonuclease Z [Pontibacillus halophilus]KGX91317.1 ribonuclease Z [Pontibacillus halophilus JSM 076056 = DSM 19796]